MNFSAFEEVVSKERIRRYVRACRGDKRKAMTLYRYNLALSGEMLKIINYFEVALRNRINDVMIKYYGPDWLRDGCLSGGFFDNPRTAKSQKIIKNAFRGLSAIGAYTHTQLLAEMDFGIWKYMYTGPQYKATGQVLLEAFPDKPKSSDLNQLDNKYIFNELNHINQIRNRIAHHEPICFQPKKPIISIDYAIQEYLRIRKLLSWMGIDDMGLMYGIDHIEEACDKIMRLSSFCFSGHNQ